MLDRAAKGLVIGCVIIAGAVALIVIGALLGALFGAWDLRW